MKSELAVVLVAALVAGSLVALAKRPATTQAVQPDAATAALLAEVDEHFTAGGKPIHPKLVHEFDGWMSDAGPVTLKLDLTNGMHANDEYYEPEVSVREVTTADDGHAVNWRHGTYGESEDYISYTYRHVGRLADGTHVLATSENGGGSGYFGGLSFVKASAEPVGDTGRWRVVLETRGTFPAGDRSDPEVRIEGNHVVYGPSRPGVLDVHRWNGSEVIRPW